MVRAAALLGAAALLAAAAGPAAAAATVESVVGAHLAWLERTPNYLAAIRTIGLQTGPVGTVFVDLTTVPAQVFFAGEIEFPSKVKRTLEIEGTDAAARAAVDDRAAAWSLPKAPFARGSFSMLERGLSVPEAVRRLEEVNASVSVVENPHGGLVGLRLVPRPDFLTRVDGLLDTLLLGGSLPRGVTYTLWFNGEGRLERMVLSEAGADSLITILDYLDTNLSIARARKYRRSVETQGKAEVYPSLLEMLLAIKQEDAARAPAPEK